MNGMKRFIVGMLAFCFSLAGMAGDEKGPAQAKPIPAEWKGKVTDAGQLPVDTTAWGTLQWVCNEKLMPGAEQTVGLSTTLPGKRNPLHVHPNCEEVLHVISGQGTHSYDGQTVDLNAGMTIRIPAGVKHNLANTGTETLKTLISFSSGDRKTVFLEELPAK
jgi:mannose-6-phosphate isomerase-like protein (cupin superfamily)